VYMMKATGMMWSQRCEGMMETSGSISAEALAVQRV